MDFLQGAADKVSKAVDNAASAVKETVKDAGLSALTTAAEGSIKTHTGTEIEVAVGSVPPNWKEWMMKTGVNSLCNADTWDFLEDSQSNKRKLALWKERGIKKITLSVEEKPEEDMSHWVVCVVDWKQGDTEITIRFYPHAKDLHSDNNWIEPGHKRWWVLRDELVFGLQLYQLAGPCFYKSDWFEGFEDVDPDSMLPTATKKFKRWFQFRHWVIYWYANAQWGYNYQWSAKPPKNPDGLDFTLDSVLSLPSMPDFKAPQLKLPSLPNVSLPDVSLPDAPSLSAPSLSAPSLKLPTFAPPDKKKRPTNRWAAHGAIELEGLHAKAKGKMLVLTDAKVTHFYEDTNGHVYDEKHEHQRLELFTTAEEQTESWLQSLKESGVREGEKGGCCTIA